MTEIETTPSIEADLGRLRDHPDFARFWCARAASGLAYQIYAVAVGWRVYALTHSPTMLGLIGLVQYLPMVAVTLAAGVVADRYNRRVVAAMCQLTAGVDGLVLALIALLGRDTVPLIFTLVALVGGVRSFEMATVSSMLPSLVPASVFPRAVAASTSANQTASIVGPAVGGLLYAFGVAVPLATAGACSLLAAAMTFSLVTPRGVRGTKSGLREIFFGIRYIWHAQIVLGAISLDLFAVLLGGATALLPVYARDILHIGSGGLGLLRSAPAIGGLTASFLFTRFPIRRRVGGRMFAAVLVFGAATIVFGVSHSLPVSLVALILLGAADMVSVTVRSGLVQLRTPNEMRGRVSAVNALFIGTSNQLGEFESGVMAGWLGPVGSVVSGGVGTLVVALLWMKLFPGLRDADGIERAPVEGTR